MNPDPVISHLLSVADVSRPLPERWGEDLGAPDWDRFNAAAERQGVLALAGCRLGPDALCAAPDEERARLQKARHGNRLRTLVAFREVDRIAEAFASVDIPCIPFKGVDLARRVYPDPAMRTFQDMDLLVPEDRLPAARRVMQELGYAVPSSLLPAGMLRRFHFHLPMLHPGTGRLVELHWRLADRDTFRARHEELFRDAQVLEGSPRLTLPPAIYAAYLCAHLGKHGYLNRRIALHERRRELLLHAWSEVKLVWLIDLQLFFNHHHLSPGQVMDTAARHGCGPAARDALALCRVVFPDFQALEPERQRLAEGLLQRMILDRMLAGMERHLDAGRGPGEELPWLLRTNKLIHVRPVRVLDVRNGTSTRDEVIP